MNAYGYKTNVRIKRRSSTLHNIYRVLRATFEVIGERIGASEVRLAAVVACFVAALGVVGGMDAGTVPFYIGFPVCVALAIGVLLTHFED